MFRNKLNIGESHIVIGKNYKLLHSLIQCNKPTYSLFFKNRFLSKTYL